MYLIRLDDASDHMDVAKWQRIEEILNRYEVKPLVGIIPENHDPKLVGEYPCNPNFWNTVKAWEAMGWKLAMHGWHHVYTTKRGGLNRAGLKSEFAGVSLEKQCEMIRDGYAILNSHDISTDVFFSPSHTFDSNTLVALRQETPIRIISDMRANDIFYRYGFHFVPVQINTPRTAPFKLTTIVLHPNTATDNIFGKLDSFLSVHKSEVVSWGDLRFDKRRLSFCDYLAIMLWWVNHFRNKVLSHLKER